VRCPGYDTCGTRKWRHLSLGRVPIWLEYAPRRVSCRKCGIITEKVPWAAHLSRFTLEFEEMVAYLSQRMDRSAVRTLMGINWRTVGTIVQRIVAERLDPKRFDNLYVIGVDEISFRRNHEYVTVVVDHAKRRVVWTGEGKSSDSLKRFFDELGPERAMQIKTVTLDMSAAFIAAVREAAPQAELIFDRFHVQKLAGEALDEVRRSLVRIGGTLAQFIKNARWALLKNPWNLTQREGEKLRDVQRTNRPLYRAYLLKETLAKALDYLQPGRAAKALDDWIAWAKRAHLAPFAKLAKTIQEHRDGILAYIPQRLSNGLTEGLNNKTRLITRRAYGFHGYRALAAMIHLCCGGIPLDPPLPAQPPISTA
jgi:transposase